MATLCSSPVRGSVIRVTRLDACGNPDPGASAVAVSKRISSVTIEEVTDDGTNIRERNFGDELCVVDDAFTSIVGYTAESTLVNSDYDPGTQTLTSYNKWRGVGDAFSAGTWIFREGAFTLVRYDVDASYDGEQNPVTILDYHTGP